MGPNPEGHGLNCTQKEEIIFKSVACVWWVCACVCVWCVSIYVVCVCVTGGSGGGGCSCRGQRWILVVFLCCSSCLEPGSLSEPDIHCFSEAGWLAPGSVYLCP